MLQVVYDSAALFLCFYVYHILIIMIFIAYYHVTKRLAVTEGPRDAVC